MQRQQQGLPQYRRLRLDAPAPRSEESTPLFFLRSLVAVVAQLVEHVHGKDEVTSSILVNGSTKIPRLKRGIL